jgi:membrane fusion protein, multidrug efflux system
MLTVTRVRLALLAVALTLTACSESPAPGNGKPGGNFGGPGGPPPTVVTGTMEKRPFGVVIEAVGTALAKESVEITSKSTNTITAVRFIEGQNVAAGAILVEFDRAQTAAALAEAEANLIESRNQFNRGRDLSVTQALSKAQLDQLKTGEARVAAAKARLADTVIRAPFAGRTGFRRVSLGGLVNPGSVITTLDDTSIIKLEFSVSQTYLNDLKPGLAVEAVAEGLGARVFGGKISAIDSRVDPVTRSVTVRAELPNANGDIKPGLFMKVRVRGTEKPTLMIPEEALVPEQGRTYVFVVEGGEAKRREVSIGGREPGSVAILSGLEGTETLVVEGMQRIRDGARVTVTARS